MNKRAAIFVLALVALSFASSCGGPEEKKMMFFEKGKAFYEQGEYDKARLALKNAVQIDPKFARAHYYIGLAAHGQRNFKRAFGSFSKAAELDPYLLEAQVEMGEYLLAAGKRKDALNKAEIALASDPFHQKALLLKSAVLIADNDTDAAVALLENLLAKDVKEPQVYQMLATAYLIRGDTAKAEGAYLDGIAANQANTALLLALAKFYQKTKKPQAAAETLLKAIEIEPTNSQYKFDLADLYWDQSRIDEAIEIVDGTLASGNAEPDSYRLAAQFYAIKKRSDKVQQTLEDGVEKDPRNIELRLMLGKHFLEHNRPHRALDILQGALESTGETKLTQMVEVKNTLAAVHLALQNEKEAAACIRDVLDVDTDSVEGHFNKGKLFLLKGDAASAVSEFKTVVGDRPGFMHGYLGLAAAYELSNQRGPAIDTLKNALKVNPNAKDVLQNLARLSVLAKDYFNAEALLRKIVAVYPEDFQARAELGDFLMAREKIEGALAQYETLQLESPDNPIGAS